MRVQNLIITVLGLLLFSMTCQRILNNPGATASVAVIPDTVVLRPTSVALSESAEPLVALSKSDIRSNEKSAPRTITGLRKIDRVQFANARTGWAGTGKTLYKTSDGGNTWKLLRLNVTDSSQISAFFFIDESQGWLSLLDAPMGANSSRLVVTHDGGESWTEQANFSEGVIIKEIKFPSATVGVAAGSRMVNVDHATEEAFAISTTDGGKTWENVSDNIKATSDGAYTRPVSDISWSGQSSISLLLRGGKVITSSDNGENWRTVVQFEDVRPNGSVSSTGYYKIVLDTRGRSRLIAGAMGEEGYWGNLITNEDGDSWRSYELTRIPIRDALFLSEKEIVASGWEIRSQDAKAASDLPAAGILLHSTDGGKSWSAIYRSKLNESFVSLTKVSENHFYAVSDAGTLLRFSLRKS